MGIETSTNIQGDCVKEQVQIVLEEENRSQKDTSKPRSKNEKSKSLSSAPHNLASKQSDVDDASKVAEPVPKPQTSDDAIKSKRKRKDDVEVNSNPQTKRMSKRTKHMPKSEAASKQLKEDNGEAAEDTEEITIHKPFVSPHSKL